MHHLKSSLSITLFHRNLQLVTTAVVAHETHIQCFNKSASGMPPDLNRPVISCQFRLYVVEALRLGLEPRTLRLRQRRELNSQRGRPSHDYQIISLSQPHALPTELPEQYEANFFTRTGKTCRNICGIGRYVVGCEVKSGWRDLNPRPLDPKSSTLPNCATPR